jgi:histidine triad (HIT) family protein
VFVHELDEYVCPFCRLVRGEDDERQVNTQRDIVRRSGGVTAFISPRW